MASNPHDPQSGEPTPQRHASFLRVLIAVFWSFLGIRKKSAGEHDTLTIKPVHVIIAGLLGAALFVAALIVLVTFITRHAA